MRDPLVAPLAAIATGVLASRCLSFEPGELLLAIAALACLNVVSLRAQARWPGAACCLLALCCAGALAGVAARPGPSPELDTESSRETVILSGCVVEPPVFFEGREQFVLELEPGARARVNLFLGESETPPSLKYGQKVELDGRVRRTRNFGNPGAFDYAHYLARKQIYWMVSARAGSAIRVLGGKCGSPFRGWILALRAAAIERLERLYAGRPYDSGMMKALLIGDSSRMEKVWVEEFRSTGTLHALVISGSHVAVLSGFLLLVLRACFLPRTLALGAAAAMAWLYALVAGWEAPVIRSAAGLTLFVAAGLFYRERRGLNLLAAVAVAFLLLDPEQLFDASFQLSFLAVAFLVAIALPLVERTSAPLAGSLPGLADPRRDSRLAPRLAQFRLELRLLAETLSLWTRCPARLAGWLVAVPARLVFAVAALILTSAVVQIGLALPMAIYFHRVSISGLSANLLIIPLMALIVPLGFVAVFTGWQLPADLAAALLSLSQRIVHVHARWEPDWRVPDPPLWLSASLALALIAAAVSLAARPVWRIASAVAVAALLGLLVWHPFPPQLAPGLLEVTTLDVGQGDAILVALPEGRLMLMDGGGIASFGRPRAARLDIGEDVVSPYLWTRSIRRIDVVALSHAHQDHIGGLGAILSNFAVGELWTGATPETPAWKALRARAQLRGVRIRPLRQGDRFTFGGAAIEALAPPSAYAPSAEARNNDSLALRITHGERSFLLTGDIERAVELGLVTGNLLSRTDVLEVAHHGSKTSTSPSFLDAARPGFALVSAGFENPYGHPHPDILARLAGRGIAVLRTDRLGLISIRTDGRRLDLSTHLWSASESTRTPVFDR
ncbi:MAG: ComEC/Rec2 family competence protein [Candidatus Solibacter usitatus]|nr:ComEC/Rec2 family competence protein [Candidatus Solibacter usitatus]